MQQARDLINHGGEHLPHQRSCRVERRRGLMHSRYQSHSSDQKKSRAVEGCRGIIVVQMAMDLDGRIGEAR